MAVDLTALLTAVEKYIADVTTFKASLPDETAIQSSVDAITVKVNEADAVINPPPPTPTA